MLNVIVGRDWLCVWKQEPGEAYCLSQSMTCARNGAAEATWKRGLSARTVKLGLVRVLHLPLKVWSPRANYLTSSGTQFPHLQSEAKNNFTLWVVMRMKRAMLGMWQALCKFL